MKWAPLAVRTGEVDGSDSGLAASGAVALHPALQGLTAFVIYLVVFIFALGQALTEHLGTPRVGQNEVDPNFYIWAWRWWVYAIAHWTNPLYSHQVGAPVGYNLAWATTSPAVALVMAPITATLGPVTSFNLTLLLAPPASAWAAFVLLRRMTGRFWVALLSASLFGFNVYMMAHEASGQPNLSVTLLLPLIVYLVYIWWDGQLGRTGYICWMAVATALEFYTFVEAFAELTLLWVFGVVIGLALAGRALRPKVLRLAAYTIVAYVIAMILSAPYLLYALANYPTALVRQLPQFSMDLAGLVVPRPDRLLWIDWWASTARHVAEPTVYVGLPLLVLLIGFAVFRWRDRLVRLLVVGFVITLALAVGPALYLGGNRQFAIPWSFIWSLPIFRSAEPIRFIDWGYLILSIVLALWLSAVTGSALARAGRWALAVLALVAVFANLLTFASVVVPSPPKGQMAYPQQLPVAIPDFFASTVYQTYIAPGEIIVVVSKRGNAAMMFQAYNGFYYDIAGGFINASLSDVSALPGPVEDMAFPTRYRGEAFEEYVRTAGVGAVVVEQAWSQKWMYGFSNLGMKPISVGGVTVFKTMHMKPVAGNHPALFPGIDISPFRPRVEP